MDKETPTLGITVPGVEWNSVCRLDSWVKRTLHVIHRLRDQVQSKFPISVEVVQKTVRRIVSIRQSGVRGLCIVDNAQGLPSLNVILSNRSAILTVIGIVGDGANGRHGFDTDNTLQSEIGLVAIHVSILQGHHGKMTYAKDPAKSSVEIWFAG